jgi:Fic family protein
MPDQPDPNPHSFLDFQIPDLRDKWLLWKMLGEAESKCQHIAGAALPPLVAQEMSAVYLAKGAHASTAIEGNTLSEAEVHQLVLGQRTQPTSREYLENEVQNVIDALTEIDRAIQEGRRMRLDKPRLKELNQKVLQGTEHEPNAVPGEFREHSVGVPSYRAVPARDIEILVERLINWIELITRGRDITDQNRFAQSVIGAIIAHVYLAWIHPFGDGNGRTARLVEAQILARSGKVPLPAINLLSDHYNRTRQKYFRAFDEARENRDLSSFIEYAVAGLLDGLREHVAHIRETQLDVAWRNYIHEIMGSQVDGESRRRRRDIVLALGRGSAVNRADITTINADLRRAFAKRGDKTLTRDLNYLQQLELIRRPSRSLVEANWRLMEAFLPPVASV